MAGTTIQSVSYNSSTPLALSWLTFTSGSANNYIDVGGKDGSKILIFVASESTKVAAGSTFWIGTSDSATTGTTLYARQYSNSDQGRMKLKIAKVAKAGAAAAFRSSGSTRLMTINVLGPFETARFKDSDGYINFTKSITGSSVAEVTAILLP